MEDLIVKGKLELNCDTEKHAGRIDVKGKFSSEGDVFAETVNVKGKVKIDKALASQNDIEVKGKIEAKSVSAKNFRLNGSIQTTHLKAENVHIQCSGGEIARLNATDVYIDGTVDENSEQFGLALASLVTKFVGVKLDVKASHEKRILEIGEIHAKKVELAAVHAKRVECDTLILRNGGRVDLLVYTGSFTVSNDSFIDKSEKSGEAE